MNTIVNQPNRRRVSKDRLNREDSQSAASLEGEMSPALHPLERPLDPPTLIPQNQVSEGEGTRNPQGSSSNGCCVLRITIDQCLYASHFPHPLLVCMVITYIISRVIQREHRRLGMLLWSTLLLVVE